MTGETIVKVDGHEVAIPAAAFADTAEIRQALRLRIMVERKAYDEYVKNGQTARDRRVWVLATMDLRLGGGTPNRVQEHVTAEPINVEVGHPDYLLDREAARVVSSLQLADRQHRDAAKAADRSKAMATTDTTAAVIEIVVDEGTCGCGCGEAVKGKSTYKQGHDARLRGILGRAHKAGQRVAVTDGNGKRKESTAKSLLEGHGFPVPENKPPKPRKPKAEKAETADANDEATEDATDEAATPEDAGEPAPTPKPRTRVRRKAS